MISIAVNTPIAPGSGLINERPVHYPDYKFSEIVCQQNVNWGKEKVFCGE